MATTEADQMARDLLTTAVEGGSNYWADFTALERDGYGGDYLRVRVREHSAHSERAARLDREVTPATMARGIRRLKSATFPAARQHLRDIEDDNHDATTADVVLQMAVFGDVIYG